jgi:protoheme IX farnesyltransferase
MRRLRFHHFAWGVLAYNLLVILGGAFVRATFSGAGCGSHWPLCGGEVLPVFQSAEKVIEFSHRAASGLALLAVFALIVWSFRAYPAKHRVRMGASLSLLFLVTEALAGAGLVRFQWVNQDASVGRAIMMSIHLSITFLLLASLTLTAWWASGGSAIRIRGQGAVGWALLLALLGTLFLGASGAVTALGDTLFSGGTFAQNLQLDLSPTAHFLIRLRILHPMIAISVALYLILNAGLLSHLRPSDHVKRFSNWIVWTLVVQTGLGSMNVFLQAPIWLQITHLLAADVLWIALVLFVASAMAEDIVPVESQAPETPATPMKATWKSYVALTKPRVISLLLFTTITAMFIAAKGWPGFGLLMAVTVGGYMAAGAANTINMVLERDLDQRMKRTASRPTVTNLIPPANALVFGFCLGAGSFILLSLASNLLAALMALAGLVFYIIVYTMLLKRRTWQNIVIGGAAGSFPPLVGWAAVTNDLSPLAWWLFAIIFLWTPVHFWALALLIKDDYAKAGVPMLPVIHGDRATVIQISLYAVLTAVVSILPMVGRLGPVYLVAAVLLNALLLARSVQLLRFPDRPHAVSMYKYSMLYLALLFLIMAVDRSMVHL